MTIAVSAPRAGATLVAFAIDHRSLQRAPRPFIGVDGQPGGRPVGRVRRRGPDPAVATRHDRQRLLGYENHDGVDRSAARRPRGGRPERACVTVLATATDDAMQDAQTRTPAAIPDR